MNKVAWRNYEKSEGVTIMLKSLEKLFEIALKKINTSEQ
jgi:hypothetical protein